MCALYLWAMVQWGDMQSSNNRSQSSDDVSEFERLGVAQVKFCTDCDLTMLL